MVPNHPRYQLRYTRIFDFCFLEISLSVVIPVVKGDFEGSFRRREKPENARVVQAFSVSALRIMDSTAALPNHPRYQLRYTRIFDFCFLEISLSVVIPVVKGDFAASFRRREKPANVGAARLSDIGAGRGSDTGAALPNHPRYQLRYTRLFDFCFLKISLSVVIPVVKGNFAASFRRREKPENARVVQAFSVSALRIMDSTAALPNHPRYQLRYTRILTYLFTFRRFSQKVQPTFSCLFIAMFAISAGFTYSLTLFETLFPRVPRLSVVTYVVKNASRPIAGNLLPARSGKRFAFLSVALYLCESGYATHFFRVGHANSAAQYTKNYGCVENRKFCQR